jgi:streptogramin lyase
VFGAGAVWVPNAADGSVVRIDPATNEVVATLDLEVGPFDVGAGPPLILVAAHDDIVWVQRTDPDAPDVIELVRIDPADNSLAQPLSLDCSRCSSLTIGPDGNLWLVDGVGTLYRVDPEVGDIVAEVEIEGAAFAAAGGDSIWVETQVPGSSGVVNGVVRVDAVTGEILASLPLHGAANVGGDDTAGWVANADNGVVQRIDLTTNTVVAEIPAGEVPVFLAVGDGSVWVGSPATGAITRVDPATNTAEEVLRVPPPGFGIAVGAGAAWVNDIVSGTIIRVDAPATATGDSQPTTIEIGGTPFDPVVGAGAVWVPNSGNSTIARIDPATNEFVATIELDVPPADFSTGPPSVVVKVRDEVVWAYRVDRTTDGGTAELVRIDPADNSLTQTITLDFSPLSLAIGPDGDLWLTEIGGDLLYRVSTDSGEVVETVEIKGAANMTAGGSSVWVVTQIQGENTVVRVDAESSEILATLPLQGAAWVASDDDVAWVTNADNGVVQRIDLATNDVVAEIPAGEVPAAIAWDGSALWTGSLATGDIMRIDPATNSATKVYAVNPPCQGVAVGEGAVWIADLVAGTVTRIDL